MPLNNHQIDKACRKLQADIFKNFDKFIKKHSDITPAELGNLLITSMDLAREILVTQVFTNAKDAISYQNFAHQSLIKRINLAFKEVSNVVN